MTSALWYPSCPELILSSNLTQQLETTNASCILDLEVSTVFHMISTGILGYRLLRYHSSEVDVRKNIVRYTSTMYKLIVRLQALLSFVCTMLLILVLNTAYVSRGSLSLLEVSSRGFAGVSWGIVFLLYTKESRFVLLRGKNSIRVFTVLEMTLQIVGFVVSLDNVQWGTYSTGLYVIWMISVVILGILAMGFHSVQHESFQQSIFENDTSDELYSNESPEQSAGFMSTLFFCWMNELISKGYNKVLEDEDVWALNPRDRSRLLYDKFVKEWKQELDSKRESASLVKVYHRIIWKRLWFGGLTKLGNDGSQFVGPIFLSLIVTYLQDSDASRMTGLLYALGIFFGQIIGVLCEGVYFQNVIRVSLQVRALIVVSVFRKSIKITNEERNKISTGKINNMISSDADAIQSFIQSIHQLWSAPLRIVVALVLLYGQLGVSALIGSLLLFAVLPLQKKLFGVLMKVVLDSKSFTDDRIKIVNELFESIGIVKSYAWEESFQDKIHGIREEELKHKLKIGIISSINWFIFSTIPLLVSVISFAVYVAVGNQLTAAKAFTSIALFDVLRFPLLTFPSAIDQFVNSRVSIKRIRDLLTAEEVEDRIKTSTNDSVIHIENGNFSWNGASSEGYLTNINFEAKKGELIGVIGHTGSGKSSLIQAILGEMDSLGDSKVDSNGSIAYVPQQAWIFNNTLQENILFGKTMIKEQYDNVIECSCLQDDVDMLVSGDMTEIGERGINLSGGQKQRVSIARAIYSNADIYLIDDPLSALDAHVGRELFEKGILGSLKDKTVVLALNQIQFLSQVDKIYFMENGSIIAHGTYDELLALSPKFKAMIMELEVEKKSGDGDVDDTPQAGTFKETSRNETKLPAKDPNAKAQLIIKEERETGHVSIKTIKRYFKAFGGLYIPIILFVFMESMRVSSSFWLTLWSDQSVDGLSPGHYVLIYAALNLSMAISTLIGNVIIVKHVIDAARILHNDMLSNLLRNPLRFFTETPIGRIINRFTKDIEDVDRQMNFLLLFFFGGIFALFGTFGVIVYSTPFTILAIIPISAMFFYTGKYFQKTNHELKRLDSIARSPIYAHFSQCLDGISSIRAYKSNGSVSNDNARKVDASNKVTLAMYSSNRWLSIRLEILGGLLILATSLYIVFQKGDIRPSTAALALGYALTITGLLNRNVRAATATENGFNSVERIVYYSETEQEGKLKSTREELDKDWPKKGTLEYKDVKMKYREDLPLVLKGLSFSVLDGERVGIVGRTGAGKSSMFISLYRLVELGSGSIVIDGVDISTVGLWDLRGKLSIIPQDPVLFTGTVRSNIDPFNEHTDQEIWSSLRRSYLESYIRKDDFGLDMEVQEKGSNFSVGQRQLLCMARALLRGSNILCMDEATASVDVQTDSLIQKTIRDEFKNVTMLIIAHRLDTIIDCDRILVLKDGKRCEYGPASELLNDPHGVFYSMVEQTGQKTAAYLHKVANGDIDIYKDISDSVDEIKDIEYYNTDAPSRRRTSLLLDMHYESKQLNEVHSAVLTLKNAIQAIMDGSWTPEAADDSTEKAKVAIQLYMEILNSYK